MISRETRHVVASSSIFPTLAWSLSLSRSRGLVGIDRECSKPNRASTWASGRYRWGEQATRSRLHPRGKEREGGCGQGEQEARQTGPRPEVKTPFGECPNCRASLLSFSLSLSLSLSLTLLLSPAQQALVRSHPRTAACAAAPPTLCDTQPRRPFFPLGP